MRSVWLGVDLGDARVGLALSDPELTLAHPIGNVRVFGDSFFAIDDVIDVIEREHVSHVVVGLPLQMDGTEGKSARKARRWAANLVKRLEAVAADSSPDGSGDGADGEDGRMSGSSPEVTMLDERLTTVSAHRQLLEANVSSRAHRPKVDQQSAVNILQAALDRRPTKGGE